ncbi:MAG: LuxR C-terminal-related transcriptional regulator [Clostridiales Family XIII bacterium]|jgi:DNA-binding CsgD family transcriptional regulator|nr:LuxR C-terminal-related transcriptional regulator [Clostridiales Family XIII bacterium]
MHNRYYSEHISNEEYGLILSFLYSIKNSRTQDIRLNLLYHLNQFFGYVGSTFWVVNEDYSLSDPVGMNIDRDLLDNYVDSYHSYDAVNPQNIGSSAFKDTVVECGSLVKDDPKNPYLARLNDYAIYHSHALHLKVGGKVAASIALFRPQGERSDSRDALSAHCLELVAPFITHEFETMMSLNETSKMASILQAALNMENTGVILFDKKQNNRVLYHNPACMNYCRDFFSETAPSNKIVQHFVNSVIVPYDSPFPEVSDLTVKLKSLCGIDYRIRIVENHEDQPSLYTAYINPLHADHAIIEDECFHSLYSILSPKEREVTLLVAQGLTNQQIADRMFIAISTVKSHLQRIFEKSNVKNRASLIAMLSSRY